MNAALAAHLYLEVMALDNRRVILDVKDLRTEFETQDGVVHAVNGITYQLREGETLGIVGESGCGKSVSVMSIMRLLPQPPARIRATSIKFFDKELTQFVFLLNPFYDSLVY